jgi:tripartite motif-containing protein 71
MAAQDDPSPPTPLPQGERGARRWRQFCVDAIPRRQFLATAGIGLLGAIASRASFATDSLPPPRFVLQWGKNGSAPGEFSANIGLAIGKDDEIYTGEFRNRRIQRFTPDGKFLSSFPVQPYAGGIAVDRAGNVYVGHWNDNKVAAYSPTGKLLREWGRKGTRDGEFQLPGSIALGPDGLLYVPDQGNSRVQKFTTDGKFVGKWGEHGKAPGQFGGNQAPGGRFAGPQFVAFDRAGNVYTTDADLKRVQKFTPDGKLLAHWGSGGSEPGGFGPPPLQKNGKPSNLGGPIGICVDPQDRVWVGATNSRVQQFTNEGKYLRGIGGLGSKPGQFHVPHALALDSHGFLYVADTMNGRVQKFDVS